MKSYTDIEQSKKLAEILPIESADMWYDNDGESITGRPEVRCGSFTGFDSINIPCWSLAALLDVLPKIYYPVRDHPTYFTLSKPKDKWYALYWDPTGMQDGEQTLADNPIDACYEMILKLNELNLL